MEERRVSNSCLTWSLAPMALPLVPPGAVGSYQTVIKPGQFGQVATSSWLLLKRQQTDFTSASSCSCCPMQKDHRKQCIPVGIPHMKSLAAAQRVNLSHPKGPVRTLPNLSTQSSGKLFASSVFLSPRGIFSTLVVRKHSLKDLPGESTQAGAGFSYLPALQCDLCLAFLF
jgi:hypothetical protein